MRDAEQEAAQGDGLPLVPSAAEAGKNEAAEGQLFEHGRHHGHRRSSWPEVRACRPEVRPTFRATSRLPGKTIARADSAIAPADASPRPEMAIGTAAQGGRQSSVGRGLRVSMIVISSAGVPITTSCVTRRQHVRTAETNAGFGSAKLMKNRIIRISTPQNTRPRTLGVASRSRRRCSSHSRCPAVRSRGTTPSRN